MGRRLTIYISDSSAIGPKTTKDEIKNSLFLAVFKTVVAPIITLSPLWREGQNKTKTKPSFITPHQLEIPLVSVEGNLLPAEFLS
ncbi:hypothetical protein V202x_21430 [Gimesia aquarii]|uniref:Uncharacterized protein n=1 Tax=Gimesia aquarii TaxID=2527964 RepID=A0A517WU26_9PLAN|nr:hypothetical protein V202x_21430 [Gimesia aquarii]